MSGGVGPIDTEQLLAVPRPSFSSGLHRSGSVLHFILSFFYFPFYTHTHTSFENRAFVANMLHSNNPPLLTGSCPFGCPLLAPWTIIRLVFAPFRTSQDFTDRGRSGGLRDLELCFFSVHSSERLLKAFIRIQERDSGKINYLKLHFAFSP